MKLNTTSGLVSFICGGFVTLCATSAQAFTPFTFTNTFTQGIPGPKQDFKLTSVSYGTTTVTDFSLVNKAEIIKNDVLTGKNRGPGSSDHGDHTVSDPHDIEGPAKELPTAADVVASLGNTNLNSIIDTEDDLGTSIFNVYFKKATDTFFFFERGKNSDLLVEAIDAGGKLLGQSYRIDNTQWKDAGFSIDTTEIASAQKVGSVGLKSSVGKIAGLRVSSFKGEGYNGPDYKVVGATVPEPATLVGLGLVAGSLVASRRRRQAGKVC